MKEYFDYKKYLSISDLDKFVPSARKNMINFEFSEKELNPDIGKKIINFLEGLERRKVNYQVNPESLPKCIFDSKHKAKLKNFKIQKKIFIDKCSKCIFLLRKECKGITKEEHNQKSPTIFDFFSIHEVLSLARSRRGIPQEEVNLILNRILDRMFEIKSANAKKMYWDYPERIADECNYDFVFHFIEAKLVLKKKSELLGNKKLMSLVKNAYKEHKEEYEQKESLMPRDNRWTKLLIMMNWLDLLSEDERKFWIKKYAYYQFTDSEPKLPQAWNRVWVLTTGLGIPNINDLKNVDGIDFSKAKSMIYSYIPKIMDLFEQNVFNEDKTVMITKYIKIRKFYNEPVFEKLNLT